MRAFLILFTFLLSLPVLSRELLYQNFSLIPAPENPGLQWDETFKSRGLIPLVDFSHGIPSLGVNQVHIVTDRQFVVVKYGVEGEFPLEEIIKTPQGHLVHVKVKDMKHALYFRGFNEPAVRTYLHALKNSTSWLRKVPSIISNAQAEDCNVATGDSILSQAGDMALITGGVAANILRNCISGIGQGILDTTGGIISGIGGAIRHPINTFEAVGDKIENFLTATSAIVSSLMTNPGPTLDRMGRSGIEGWDRIKSSVMAMSPPVRTQFLCSLIGALGVDAAIAFFTVGTLAPKVALTFATIGRKFSLMGNLIELLSRLGSIAGRLGPDPDMLKRLMDKIMGNEIPDSDLQYLNNMTTLGDEMVMGTMRCYI